MILRISRMSTGRLVVRLSIALIASTVITAVVAGWAFRVISHTAETVRTQNTQAALELSATRSALIGADSAAMTSFNNEGADLAGPGQDYQNQVAAAAQSLARFAQLNGSRDVQTLQVVEGMLSSYSSSIGQADAYQHQEGGGFLATNELWNASQLVHQPGGILDQLQTLQEHQHASTRDRLGSGWMSPWTIPIWSVLLALVLALLIATQVFCRRRFRRQVNLGLLGATVVTLALIGTMVLTAVSAQRLRDAQHSLDSVIDIRNGQMSRADSSGQYALAVRLHGACGRCGFTVEHFAAGLQPHTGSADRSELISRQTRAVNERMRVAAETYGLGIVIAGLAILLLFSIIAGLYPRIAEYRYAR